MKQVTINFMRGAGSVIDLLPAGSRSKVGQGIDLGRSDAETLRRDWRRVARDFQTAFEQTTGVDRDHVQSKQTK